MRLCAAGFTSSQRNPRYCDSVVGRSILTEARKSQSGYPGSGAETGGLLVGGGQIRPAVPGSQPLGGGNGGRESGIRKRSELTSGKGCFPTRAARLEEPDARTVLAVKGSLRRAKNRRALDCCGPFRRRNKYDGRLRRENNHGLLCAATQRFASDPPAGPRRKGDCHREVSLLMGHIVCFEVGRSTQTQSSATALRCSRKWMSGHAEALAQSVTDPNRRIKATVVPSAGASQETLPINTGRGVFSLDKSLSWTSPLPSESGLRLCRFRLHHPGPPSFAELVMGRGRDQHADAT